MENIKKFKTDIIAGITLIILFCIYSFVMVGHQSFIIIDVGRETYIPWQILKGQVLYKDIVNIYGPLSYQINAALYFILGQSVNTLYLAGIVNSLLILGSFYLLSRLLTSPLMSFAMSLFVMSACVFNSFIFNFIFPYSYAAVYALSSYLFAMLFLLYYLKFSNKCFIYLSFLFMGISIACKYEYTLFTAVLIIIALFLKKLNFKELLVSAGIFISVPAISLSILFLQGMNLSDLMNAAYIVKKIYSAPSLKFFYTFSGYYFSFRHIVGSFDNFSAFFLVSTLPFSFIYLALSFHEKIKALITSKNYIWIIYTLSYIFLMYVYFVLFTKYAFSERLFSWMPLTTTAILICLCVSFLKKGIKNTDIKDLMYLIITAGALIASFKSYFSLNLHLYGTFMFPLVSLVNFIFITDYLPKSFNFSNTYNWKSACAFYLIFLSLVYGTVYTNIGTNIYKTHIKTDKGVIYSNRAAGTPVNDLIRYISTNVPKESKILIIPEGVIINFLTQRDSDNRYYSLLPLNIESFGEKNIINDLKKNPPDYIFINNRNTGDYGYKHICNDYAKNLCKFITQNYDFKIITGSEFITKIYKLKDKSGKYR